MAGQHTAGPLTLTQDEAWPYRLRILTAAGDEVHSEDMACWSSRWNSLQDAHDLRGIYGAQREEWQAALDRQMADLRLRAAAPDLLEALKTVQRNMQRSVTGIESRKGWDLARAAIARATGDA